MSWRLRVDPTACDAFGHCAELVPEMVSLDEWGYPIVEGGAVPDELGPYVDMAVRLCPRRALFLERLEQALPPESGSAAG